MLIRFSFLIFLMQLLPTAVFAEYSLTVSSTPSTARVRVMNIVEKYQPGMILSQGDYRIQVDAPGHETEKRNIRLSSDRHLSVILKSKFIQSNVARNNVSNVLSSTAQVSGSTKENKLEDLVTYKGEEYIFPTTGAPIPIVNRVMLPSELDSKWGNTARLMRTTVVYESHNTIVQSPPRKDAKTIDRLRSGSIVISLQRINSWHFIVYKKKGSGYKHGWIHTNFLDRTHVRKQGTAHEKWMRSILSGYFDQVEPIFLQSGGVGTNIKISPDGSSVSVGYKYGMKVPVVINHQNLSKVLVRSTVDSLGADVYHWVKREQFLSGEELAQVKKHGTGDWLAIVQRTEFGIGLAKKFLTTPVLLIAYLVAVAFLLATPSFWDFTYIAGKILGVSLVCSVLGFIVFYGAALLLMEFYGATSDSDNWFVYLCGILIVFILGIVILIPLLIMAACAIVINYTWPILLMLTLPGLLIFAYDLFYYFIVAGGALTKRHGAEAGLHASKHQEIFNVEVANSVHASFLRPFKTLNTWSDGIHYEVQSRRMKKMNKLLDEEAEILKKYENTEKLRERKRNFDYAE